MKGSIICRFSKWRLPFVFSSTLIGLVDRSQLMTEEGVKGELNDVTSGQENDFAISIDRSLKK